jgi:recombination protein RecR
MKLPKAVSDLIEAFERLPGIGPKTAARLTYYLIHAPKEESEKLAQAAANISKNTIICSICRNVTDSNPCSICSDQNRDQTIICVVEQALDVLALERSGAYKGLYHVLHGKISPINNIGPEELHIRELLPRLKNDKVSEIILATNPDMEGEATAMYLQRLITPLKIKVTRIARGIPVGGDLEYADEVTLRRALEGRREY